MRQCKKGFTLAEVLITLSIVGVVASLTLPALQANIQKNKIGPAVAKAMNTMSSINKTAFVQDGTDNLTTVCATYYADCLDQFAIGSKLDDTTFVTSDGMQFKDTQSVQALNGDFGNKYSGTYYAVEVDIDGPNKGANTYGRDKFMFWVDSQGIAIPYGSYAYTSYNNLKTAGGPPTSAPTSTPSSSSSSNSSSDNWSTLCPNNTALSTLTSDTSKMACTGSVVDNGYTVQYKP